MHSAAFKYVRVTIAGFMYQPCGFVLVFQPADSQLSFLICWYMCTLADLGFLNRTSGSQDKHILPDSFFRVCAFGTFLHNFKKTCKGSIEGHEKGFLSSCI